MEVCGMKTITVKVRVDPEVYEYFTGQGIDWDRLFQYYMNQINYFFREGGVYENMRGVDAAEAWRRMADEYESRDVLPVLDPPDVIAQRRREML